MDTAVELDLPVDLGSVREARSFIAGLDGLAPERLADAQLVVSELVANALVHAGPQAADRIVVSVWRRPTTLRIDVDDGGTFTAASESFAYSRADGRNHGLRIIQLLARRWQAENGRVTVWLEV